MKRPESGLSMRSLDDDYIIMLNIDVSIIKIDLVCIIQLISFPLTDTEIYLIRAVNIMTSFISYPTL